MAILIWIPVAAVFVSRWPAACSSGARLGLSTWPLALAALCMALAPTTQFLHGTRADRPPLRRDAVRAGIRWPQGSEWLHEPETTMRAAVGLGRILGAAPAIHNGLFILQLPLLATLFIRWLQGIRQLARAAERLVRGDAAACTSRGNPHPVDSRSATGRFEFYTLSWFHLYVAFCTATFVALLSRLHAELARALAVLARCGDCAASAADSLTQIDSRAVRSSRSRREWLDVDRGNEVAAASDGRSAGRTTRDHSASTPYLIWLAPLTFAPVAWCNAGASAIRPRLLFWVSSRDGPGAVFASRCACTTSATSRSTCHG